MTNGVVTEVPRFHIVNFHGEAWQHVAKYGNMWQRARIESKVSQHAGDLWPFCEGPLLSRPHLEAGDQGSARGVAKRGAARP